MNVPSLVIAGDSDQLTPPDLAEEMAALIPGADLHILPNCGHLPVLEYPEMTTVLLRGWLGA